MPINIPNSVEVVKNRSRSSVQSLINNAHPFIRGSWIGALIDSLAERMYDFYITIRPAIDEVLPDTTSENLDRWGSFYGVSRNSATPSVGQAVLYVSGTTDPVYDGTIFIDHEGNEYISIGDYEFASGNISQVTLTRSGTVATFVCDQVHNLKNGDSVTIAGASDSGFNGTVAVTITDDDTFTYTVDSGISASATGAYFAKITLAINIQSSNYGNEYNLGAFEDISLQSPIAGFDDAGFINWGGLLGAQDEETTEDFRSRILDIIRNPISHFNVSDITRIAKTVSGITRVFVLEATPAVGQVTIYVMSDNLSSSIPTVAKVTEVKNKILTIKPANTSDSDVIVNAPTAVSTNFTFSALSPNTSTMRAAVTENLRQFFAENPQIGTDVVQDAYRSAIFSTIDTTTGEQVNSFTLSSPSSDITISTGEIATLGTVSFA